MAGWSVGVSVGTEGTRAMSLGWRSAAAPAAADGRGTGALDRAAGSCERRGGDPAEAVAVVVGPGRDGAFAVTFERRGAAPEACPHRVVGVVESADGVTLVVDGARRAWWRDAEARGRADF